VISDLLVMGLSFALATELISFPRQRYSLAGFINTRFEIANLIAFIILAIAWFMLFRGLGLYQSRRLVFPNLQVFEIFKATGLGTMVFIALFFLRGGDRLSPRLVMVFFAASVSGTLVCRTLLLVAQRYARLHGRNLRHILIVGTNVRARRFAEEIAAAPELGFRVRGFADDRWEGTEEFEQSGGEIVTDLKGLTNYVREHVVDEVVLSLPFGRLYEEAARISRLCQEQGIVVRLLPGMRFLGLGSTKSTLDLFNDEPVITLLPAAISGWRLGLKRFLDVTIAAILLILLLPLMIVLAILVKLTSPGPIFFVQVRVGLNKRRFSLLKFRTMVENAEGELESLESLNEASGPVFKIKDDPRLTPCGRFLRRTSLDELPQLINVLMGDMSLVGPRPLPVRDYEGFDQDWHRRRLSVRPGITCLWQVAGRSTIKFDRWMELDMEYIDHWSLLLDFNILMRTVGAVLKGRGAA
jgi:exopolysaccharide biosynthesis polyprenyl glycosylphosphotransferase